MEAMVESSAFAGGAFHSFEREPARRLQRLHRWIISRR
jgi:hypothetical protein